MTERKYDGRACGAGDAGLVDIDKRTPVGPCPSCGALIETGYLPDPTTGKRSKAMLHPIPFCNYYGATDPDAIEADIAAAGALS